MHNFVFKAEWIQELDILPAHERMLVVEAIFNYAVYGTVPSNPMLNFATLHIRKQIDRARQNRERALARRREKAEKAAEPENAAEKPEQQPELPKTDAVPEPVSAKPSSPPQAKAPEKLPPPHGNYYDCRATG